MNVLVNVLVNASVRNSIKLLVAEKVIVYMFCTICQIRHCGVPKMVAVQVACELNT